MRNYGRIEIGFWQNQRVRRLSERARLLLLYLYSCSHSNMVGCYPLPDGYIMADHEWDAETVRQTLLELLHEGFIERDPSGLTRIVGWWGHNDLYNPNIAKSAAKVIFQLPHKSPVFVSFIRDLRSRLGSFKDGVRNELERVIETVSPTLLESLDEQLTNGLANHSETIPQTNSKRPIPKPIPIPEQQQNHSAAAAAKVDQGSVGAVPDPLLEPLDRCLDAAGLDPAKHADPGWHTDQRAALEAWLAAGCDLERDILATIRRIVTERGKTGKTLGYFGRPVLEARDRRLNCTGSASDAEPIDPEILADPLYHANLAYRRAGAWTGRDGREIRDRAPSPKDFPLTAAAGARAAPPAPPPDDGPDLPEFLRRAPNSQSGPIGGGEQ